MAEAELRSIDTGNNMYINGSSSCVPCVTELPGCWLLAGFAAGYDPASNKLYERQLHAGCRGVVYGSGPSGSGPGHDSLDRLLAWRRGLPAPGGGRVASPLGLASGDAVMSVRVGR